MNKKVSLGVTISLIAVACAITFVLTMTVSLNMYNSMVAGVQEREAINSKIKEVDSFVRGSSLYTLEEQDIINGIMNGYISGVDDEYARYYTTEENYRRQELEKGIVTGTGMNTVVSGDYLEVTQVYSGSSAAVNGIQRGTMITAIDSNKKEPSACRMMLWQSRSTPSENCSVWDMRRPVVALLSLSHTVSTSPISLDGSPRPVVSSWFPP